MCIRHFNKSEWIWVGERYCVIVVFLGNIKSYRTLNLVLYPNIKPNTTFIWCLQHILVDGVIIFGKIFMMKISTYLVHHTSYTYCEAQARVRQGSAREGKGWPLRRKALKLKTLAKSLAYTKVGCHRKSHYAWLMAWWGPGEAGGGKRRCVGLLGVKLGSL